MRPAEYAGEMTQALVVGVIAATIVGAILYFSGIQIGNLDPSLVTIIVMFAIGTISVWWALFKLKGKSFFGLG